MSEESAYAKAGVDISAGQEATRLMKSAVQETYGPEVLNGIGAFGGLFSAAAFKGMVDPILVASTDGVGTKTKVASALGRWDTMGFDIVNHCTNDILVQGARPLFFLDYVASSKLDPVQIATVVKGIAEACKHNGCALLGGETAEMPGVYAPNELDLVGTIVGIVDRPNLIDGSRIEVGHKILSFPSSGAHTNGYTLLRAVLDDIDWNTPLGDGTIADAIIAPHRSYMNEVFALRDGGIDITGLAHITGGGVTDNLPRIFAEGIGAEINLGTWDVNPIFQLIAEKGNIPTKEMYHVFNMGLGMLVVLPEADVAKAQELYPELSLVGEIIAGEGVTLNE